MISVMIILIYFNLICFIWLHLTEMDSFSLVSVSRHRTTLYETYTNDNYESALFCTLANSSSQNIFSDCKAMLQCLCDHTLHVQCKSMIMCYSVPYRWLLILYSRLVVDILTSLFHYFRHVYYIPPTQCPS